MLISCKSRAAALMVAVLLAATLLTCSPLALVASGSVKPRARSFAWNGLVVGYTYVNALCPRREAELCQWLGLYYEIYEADGKMIRAKDLLLIPIAGRS